MSAVRDFMSGGNSLNEGRIDEIHDTQKAIIEAEAYAMAKSEQFSESEINNFVSENNEKNEKARKENMADAKAATNKAIGINIVGAALSVGLAGSAVASKSSTVSNNLSKVGTKIASGAKGVANAGKSAIKTVGSTIAKKVPTLGKVATSKVVTTIGKSASKVVGTAGKVVGATGKVGGATIKYAGKGIGKISSNHPFIATGLTMAPLGVTQLYTRIKANDKAEELEDTLKTLNDHLENMEKNKDKYGDDFKHQCESFASSYNEANTALLNKYSTGEMSNEEYAKATEEMAKEYSEKIEIMKEEFPEIMRSEQYENGMVDAAHANMNKYAILENSWMYAEQNEKHPEVMEQCEIIADNKNGTAETGFGRFWKSLNATIIKYVPAVAYVEAVALKAVDSTYDFIRDTIKGYDTRSKYQNESITSLAESIQTDCAEHLQKREVAANATEKLQDGGASVDNFMANNQTELAQLEDKYTPAEQQDDGYALV